MDAPRRRGRRPAEGDPVVVRALVVRSIALAVARGLGHHPPRTG
jgi:hypothetical protein